MDARKFSIGDRVRLRLDHYANDNPADVYTVSRALPELANVWQYRVKRVGDGQERAVNEQQLAKVDLQGMASQPMAEAQQDMQRARNARATARTRVPVRQAAHEGS